MKSRSLGEVGMGQIIEIIKADIKLVSCKKNWCYILLTVFVDKTVKFILLQIKYFVCLCYITGRGSPNVLKCVN